ncbi:MAG TPA: energy transducer TonB [Puia sp.]|jgi:protein TonB|nr:energy transducer TonB [Puia sp.]
MKYQLIIFLMIAALRCAAQDTTKETIYTRVEIESAFPFGQSAWSRFLDKNLHYPWKARDKSIQGTVVVEFIVDKEGNTSYIHAISGPEELRQEAERLIKVSRKWTPAIQDGRQVWSHKRMPIEFKLDN